MSKFLSLYIRQLEHENSVAEPGFPIVGEKNVWY